MPVARLHHYIPQWYLSGFTDTGTAEGYITVHDIVEDRDFRTRPRGVGGERDFNRVEVEGLSPDVLEQAWSDFETPASQAVSRIVDAGNLDNRDDLTYLLNLVALLAVRNPRFRNQMNQFLDRIARVMGQQIVASEERFNSLMVQARADGVDIPEDISYVQIRDFIDRNEYDIIIPREQNIQQELGVVGTVIDLLHRRNWSLFTPANSESHFVSCDHPVVLSWRDPNMRGPIGYGLTNTEVTFPINKKYLIVGVYEEDLDSFQEVGDEIVAFANTQRRNNALRHVYSSSESYLFANKRSR
jgi:hypothetical protein